jgi:peptidyl-prolyl cis-trans isomerase D
VLDLMRKHAQSWLIKVALGGIIVVFVFWYGWSGSRDKTRSYAAKVNDTVISHDQFYSVYETELEKIRVRFKGAMPPDLIEKLNLKKSVITSLVHQILMLQEASRLGMFATDEDLVRDIRSNPLFSRNGVFDEGVYRSYLNSIKMSPQMFEQARKQELVEEQLVRLLTDAVKTDPAEITRWWHFQNDKLILSILLVKSDEKPKTTPDLRALESYYKKNQAKYEIPQSLNLQYVVFSWPDIQKKLSNTDTEIRDYYQMNPREFLIPEKLKIRHILVKIPENAGDNELQEARKKAEGILKRIRGGEDFEKIARLESQDTSSSDKGGDLGFSSVGTMQSNLEEAATKLEVGQISEPILTSQGYHLIRLDDKQAETSLEFETVKDQIAEKLLERKARSKLSEDAENFYEQVYRTEDLEGQAKKFGFNLLRQDFVSKAGSLPPVGNDPEIIEEAFRLKTGEISKMIKSGDSYIVLKLLEKNKERIPAFEEVRSQVERDVIREQAGLEAEKRAEEVIQSLKEQPNGADAVAKKFGLTWDQLEPISRTAGFVPQLGSSPEISEMLTTISKDSPLFPRPIPTSEGVAVVRLKNVEKASDEQFAKEEKAFEKWVLEVRKTEFLKGWIRLLEDRSKIDINEKLL